MLDCAIKKTIPNKLTFSLGRIQGLDLHRTFDVVISLFHVMSYQVSNSDIMEAFATARRHLNPGGIFIFDFSSLPITTMITVYQINNFTVFHIGPPILNQIKAI